MCYSKLSLRIANPWNGALRHTIFVLPIALYGRLLNGYNQFQTKKQIRYHALFTHSRKDLELQHECALIYTPYL